MVEIVLFLHLWFVIIEEYYVKFLLFDAGFALSSVEGRVAMEFFDLSEAAQAKK